MNSIEISGVLVEREAVRFTPAGIEVFEATFFHRSEAIEAGRPRTLEFHFDAISFGETAKKLNALEISSEIRIRGFLAPRTMKTKRLTVHITEFN